MITTSPVSDETQLRRVFGALASGVATLAALRDTVPVGLAVSSFTSVSLSPALVSACVAHTSTTWPRLSGASRLGVSVLAAHQDQICRQPAARDVDRFADLDWQATADGAIFLEGASAWLDCSLETTHPAGDHEAYDALEPTDHGEVLIPERSYQEPARGSVDGVGEGLKLGICSEQGGDPSSVHLFDRVGLDHVSCSPFRVPVARLEVGRLVNRRPRTRHGGAVVFRSGVAAGLPGTEGVRHGE